RCVRLIFLRQKTASQHWLNAKHIEEVAAHSGPRDSLRLAALHRQRPTAHPIKRGVQKGLVLRRPVLEVRHGNIAVGNSLRWISSFEIDNAGRFRIRQRTQQHSVYYAENCGVCANAERESDYRD